MAKGKDYILGESTGIKVSHIIKTSIVTAFTIAAAFIWKDVILEFMKYILPGDKSLFGTFLAALVATLIVIILIYAFLKTESEVEFLVGKIKNSKGKEKEIKGVKIIKV